MILRKLVALLLFVLAVALTFFMFIFLFLNFEWSLIINSNIEDYNINITSVKTTYSLDKTCENKECVINNIPVWEVKIILSKTDYHRITKTAIINKDFPFKLDIKLSKLSRLIPEKENNTSVPKISNKLKLIRSKFKKELEANANQIEEKESIIVLEEEWDFIKIFEYNIKEKKLLSEINTKNLDIKNISLARIENTENQYYVKIDNSIYIIWGNNKDINFKFKPEINYIKHEQTDDTYIIISDTGVFVLDENNKLEYNTKFDDFVIYNKNYIWYIKQNSSEKLADFWLNYFDWYIIKYNPNTLEKNIILKPNVVIVKILKKWNDIYALDNEDTRYKLEINN